MYLIPVIALLALPLLGTIYAIWAAFQGDISTFNVLMCVIGVILTEYGITMGYHRLVVHKAYEPHPALKAIVLALGSMAFQGPVVNWASVHTKHHAFSDQEGDPHSPTISGFLYAHFEWLLAMNTPNMNEIKAKWGARYTKDPMIDWFSRTFLFWGLGSLVIPAIIGYFVGGGHGAWMGFIWGGLVRIFISSHVTWSVNSVCHYVGGRMFTTTDKSRNNFIVGILALGEGWHNNHHAFPASAFHGMKWWQIDVTGLSIRLFEAIGLVKKVVRIPDSLLEKRREDGKKSAVNVQVLAMTEDPVEEEVA
ncbi:MAG: fatty acid desaturase [Ignavibacteria bacterium]|nr:fatty acid desaturase [Ignavibacteria bacterium]MBL0321207.1 fatty acid desaturase [Ignavibacteria bacterium]